MSQVTNVLIIASFHLNQQKRSVANVPSHQCPEVVNVGITISLQCVPTITNTLSVRSIRAQQAAKRLLRNPDPIEVTDRSFTNDNFIYHNLLNNLTRPPKTAIV